MGLVSLTSILLLALAPVQAGTVPPAPPVADAVLVDTPQADSAPVQAMPPAPPPVEPPAAPTPAVAAPPHQHHAAPDNPENDIVVTAERRPTAPDPFQAVNATSFAVTQAVDSKFIGPVSLYYKKHVPSPFRKGVHNLIYHLREPIVFLNFLLQHKIGKAAETVGRFAVNSTAGAGGLVDVAKRKPFYLPRRGNGFADTLGFYGVPNGPFMFLPIVGPTTVRDLFGGFVRAILPIGIGKPFNTRYYALSAGVLGALDHRADFDEELHILHDNVPNPYAATRDFYLRRRQAEIDYLKGKRTEGAAPMSENPLGYIAPERPPGKASSVPATAPAVPPAPAAPQPASQP